MQFRPDIQGLRAIAVLAVIIFHLNPAWLPGGFVGVDVFLVISGYLIASILLQKKAKPEYRLATTLSYFYTSRFKRIAPAYFATLVVVSLLAAVLFLPTDFSTYGGGLKKAVWFNSNNYFAGFGDYFAPVNHEQPLLHTWSLAIEIQFYLLAPFIFLLIPKQWLRWLLPTAIILLTAYAEYRLQQGIQQATYYSLSARLPAFFIGGWVALVIANNYNRGEDRYGVWLSFLAVALIAFAFIIPKPTGHFPGIAGLVPVTAAALLIWLNVSNRITALLSTKTMVWIGSLSYSLYLWHWPVLAFMRYYTGAEILDWQFSFAFIGLTLVLAIASYYWIETPLRQKHSKIQLTGYACLLLITLGTWTGIKNVNAYFTPDLLSIEYTRYADPLKICHGQIIDECFRGDLASDREILVLGDSHAAMLNHFFDYLGKEIGFKARIITGSSCVTIPDFDYKRIPEWAQGPCVNQIQAADEYIQKSDTIVVAGMWSYQTLSAEFNISLQDFVQSNLDKEIMQIPKLEKEPDRIKRFHNLGLLSEQTLDQEYLFGNDRLLNLISNFSNVQAFGLSEESLFESVPVYDDQIIYLDSHHLNEVGSILYAKFSESQLESYFK